MSVSCYCGPVLTPAQVEAEKKKRAKWVLRGKELEKLRLDFIKRGEWKQIEEMRDHGFFE